MNYESHMKEKCSIKCPSFFRAPAREEVGGEKKGKRESRTCVNREHAIVLRNEVRVCGIP